VAAPPGAVFGAVSEADQVAQWWGPRGFAIPALDFQPRAGASYRIEMQPPDGDSFHVTGEFRVVEPPARLAFTFVWEPADPDDVETLADLSLQDLGESTELGLTQGPFKTEDRLELHHGGWTDSLDKLEQHLTRRS
jgi:uncharacterized protein YndB with AHSA1/START domain